MIHYLNQGWPRWLRQYASLSQNKLSIFALECIFVSILLNCFLRQWLDICKLVWSAKAIIDEILKKMSFYGIVPGDNLAPLDASASAEWWSSLAYTFVWDQWADLI